MMTIGVKEYIEEELAEEKKRLLIDSLDDLQIEPPGASFDRASQRLKVLPRTAGPMEMATALLAGLEEVVKSRRPHFDTLGRYEAVVAIAVDLFRKGKVTLALTKEVLWQLALRL
jgi:hypothetical protein